MGSGLALAGRILGTLIPLAFTEASATPPPPYQLPAGFVNARMELFGEPPPVQRLPAGAKGGLFLLSLRPSFVLATFNNGDDVVLGQTPAPLQVREFQIESGDQGLLPATLHRLSVERQLRINPGLRYWYVQGSIKKCLVAGKAEMCLGSDSKHPLQGGKLTLALSKKLKDVTSQVHEATGWFRIGPAGGFKPGGSYKLNFARKGTEQDDFLFPREITIRVDTLLLPPALTGFRLMLEGGEEKGMSPSGIPFVARTLKFAMPSDYERYRASMLFVFEHKDPEYEGILFSGKGNPFTGIYAWGTDVPNGSDRFSSQPPGPAEEPRQFRMVGLAGLLEVDDEFHETPDFLLEMGGRATSATIKKRR